MFRRRRRPLLRGAMVAGGAYAVGKHVQGGRDADEADAIDAEAAPAAPGAVSEAGLDELKQLAELKEQGVLTDAEFDAQKQKILQGG